MATARLLGASIKRREDPRFITGKGNYTDDLKLAGMTHAVVRAQPARQRQDPQDRHQQGVEGPRASSRSSPART